MTVRIVLASRNAGKARELFRLFAEPRITLSPMSQHVPDGFEVDETQSTFEGNAWLKALALCQQTGLPALADDSGLEVDALGGRPGVYSARFAGSGASDEDNNALLLRQLGAAPALQRRARFRCVLVLAAASHSGPRRIGSAQGTVEGTIVRVPRGENGFGYDPLFEPLETPGLTTAEMSPERKDQLSHRARAARQLTPLLSAWLDENGETSRSV